jgi:hypothetical protein
VAAVPGRDRSRSCPGPHHRPEQTRKYAATGAAGWDGIVVRAMADVRAALHADPGRRVGVVQDGAHELWTVTRAALAAEPLVTTYREAIDRYHLSERLGAALRLVDADPTTRRTTYARWPSELDTSAGAIDVIEAALWRAATDLDSPTADALQEHLTYLDNNKDRMRYTTLRAHGLPIGSGATESACNTLRNLRAKRNAEHWSEAGLEGVLTLRGIHQSDRFDPFWQRLANAYVKDVTPVRRAA